MTPPEAGACALLLVLAATVCLASEATVAPSVADRPNLAAAKQVADWLRSVRIETAAEAPDPLRVVWPADPATPEVLPHGLYHGTAGVVLFQLELYRATDDPVYRAEAVAGAETLVRELERIDADVAVDVDASLWTGVSGYGYVLGETARVTGEGRFKDAARDCVRRVRQAARPWPDADSIGVAWNDVTDIIRGSAGIGFFLLYAHEHLDETEAIVEASRAGYALVDAAAIEVPVGGSQPALKWPMAADYARLMPNYSHGTAGVCDYLVALDRRIVADPELAVDLAYHGEFLAAARRGAEYLLTIADMSGGGCRIFHHEPEGEDLFYLGWCHGPAGTGRFFRRLAVVDDSPVTAQLVARSVRSVIDSDIPRERPPGFWNNVGVCCGSAGVASFLLDYHRWTGDRAAIVVVRQLTDDILERAERVPLAEGRVGLRWMQAEHRVRPEELAAQTGLMQGAAGVGLWLLKLDAFETGREFGMELPP